MGTNNLGGWAEGRTEVSAQGRMSKVEQEFIRANSYKMLDSQMAEELGRRLEAVEDFRRKHRIRGLSDGADDNEISSYLKKSVHWEFLMQQFSDPELKYIENVYKGIVKQFGNDVLVTEELSVIELLKTEILINRNLRAVNEALQMKDRLLLLIEKIEKDKRKGEDKKAEEIAEVSKQVVAIDNGGQSRTKEYDILSGKKSKILSDLKATREQRFKAQEQSKTNFFEWLKTLDDEDNRAAEGELLAIFKRAAEREKKKLSTPHKYADEMVDLPILTAETVENYDRAELEGEKDGIDKTK